MMCTYVLVFLGLSALLWLAFWNWMQEQGGCLMALFPLFWFFLGEKGAPPTLSGI